MNESGTPDATDGSFAHKEEMQRTLRGVSVQLVSDPIETADLSDIEQLTASSGWGLSTTFPFVDGSEGKRTQMLITSGKNADSVSIRYRTSAEDGTEGLKQTLDEIYGESALLAEEQITLEGLLNLDCDDSKLPVHSYSWRNTGNIQNHELTTRQTSEDLLSEEDGQSIRPFVDSIVSTMSSSSAPAMACLTFGRGQKNERSRNRADRWIKKGVKGYIGEIIAHIIGDVRGEDPKKDYEELNRELQNVIDSIENKDLKTSTRVAIDFILFGSKQDIRAAKLRDALTMQSEWSGLTMTESSPSTVIPRVINMTVPTRRTGTRWLRDRLPFHYPNYPWLSCGRKEAWYLAVIPPQRLSEPAKDALNVDPESAAPTRLPQP